MKKYLSKFIGSKEFYRMVILMVIPMVVQQGITNFVSLIDNIMVGRLGTESMSGVAIVNQLIFVFNLSIFGCISGASILGAQYYGMKDHEGVRYSFRFKLISGFVVLLGGLVVFLKFGDPLISLYLSESGENVGNIAQTFAYSQGYLKIMLIGLLPFVISQAYASSLRDTGETMIPMIGSIIAVLVNLSLNGVLIFGLFGFPKMGVKGAAVATVISRYFEMIYIMWKTHHNQVRFPFIQKALRNMYIPRTVGKKIFITGLPLFINELLWGVGMAAISQSYSVRGLMVVAAHNISNTISSLFMIVFLAMGNVLAIIVGQQLGANEIEKAKDTDRKLIFFNVVVNIVIAVILMLIARYIPLLYNVDESVRQLATKLLFVVALAMPLSSFNHSAYFTMRCGGKTMVTFLFDSVYTWVISIPLAYVLSRYTLLPIITVFFIVSFADIIKAIIGFFMIKSGVWANNII